jgi:NhaP-type Na+/H+ or K+/H+ antiporter
MAVLAMIHNLDTAALATAAACILLWSVLSARLERLYISAPIALLVMGLVVTHGPLAIVRFNPHSSTVRSLAEVTLALVLFTDASRVNVIEVRRDIGLPVRLLAFGLPLTIGLGTATAYAIIPAVSWWVAAVIGSIVAPTDAALGASIIGDKRIPNRIRRLLNIESGLNDGIATPFVNLFLAGAVSTEVAHSMSVLTAAGDLLIGAGIGGGVGVVGGWVMTRAAAGRWSAPEFRPLAALGLAFFAYSSAVEAQGNGFIAAFIAGMAFGSVLRSDLESTVAFTEEAGGLLSLVVWLIFGAAMVVPGFTQATWPDYLFALLALTVVRLLPVALSLLGSGLDRFTVGFIGWFGPRGLASVVFGLIAYDSLAPVEAAHVLSVVTVTITLSVLAHGFSASPLAARYGSFVRTLMGHMPEHASTPSMRARTRLGSRVARSP